MERGEQTAQMTMWTGEFGEMWELWPPQEDMNRPAIKISGAPSVRSLDLKEMGYAS